MRRLPSLEVLPCRKFKKRLPEPISFLKRNLVSIVEVFVGLTVTTGGLWIDQIFSKFSIKQEFDLPEHTCEMRMTGGRCRSRCSPLLMNHKVSPRYWKFHRKDGKISFTFGLMDGINERDFFDIAKIWWMKLPKRILCGVYVNTTGPVAKKIRKWTILGDF